MIIPVHSTDRSENLARRIRKHCVQMCHDAGTSHIGSNLSCCDLIAVLYSSILRYDPNQPQMADRDRFIMSKGHAAAVIYAVLAETGFIPEEKLREFCQNGSPIAGHVHSHGVPGIEFSTGSLGHGLPVGCGIALAARADKSNHRVFVLMSDGECDEGTTWEAALFAAQHRLGGLTAIIDTNSWQSYGSTADVLDLEPFADKWKAFRWDVTEVNGHDHQAIQKALSRPVDPNGPPRVVIARTVKGKGIPHMEDQLVWHYRSPSDEDVRLAQSILEDPNS